MATEKLYECMFLCDSNVYASDPDSVVDHVVELIEKSGGELSAHRPWLDGKLAYEIEGQRKGLHYLTCFKTTESDTISKLARNVRLSELVLRHLPIVHPPVLYNQLVAALNGEDVEDEEEDDEAASADGDTTDTDDDADDSDD